MKHQHEQHRREAHRAGREAHRAGRAPRRSRRRPCRSPCRSRSPPCRKNIVDIMGDILDEVVQILDHGGHEGRRRRTRGCRSPMAMMQAVDAAGEGVVEEQMQPVEEQMIDSSSVFIVNISTNVGDVLGQKVIAMRKISRIFRHCSNVTFDAREHLGDQDRDHRRHRAAPCRRRAAPGRASRRSLPPGNPTMKGGAGDLRPEGRGREPRPCRRSAARGLRAAGAIV